MPTSRRQLRQETHLITPRTYSTIQPHSRCWLLNNECGTADSSSTDQHCNGEGEAHDRALPDPVCPHTCSLCKRCFICCYCCQAQVQPWAPADLCGHLQKQGKQRPRQNTGQHQQHRRTESVYAASMFAFSTGQHAPEAGLTLVLKIINSSSCPLPSHFAIPHMTSGPRTYCLALILTVSCNCLMPSVFLRLSARQAAQTASGGVASVPSKAQTCSSYDQPQPLNP